MLFNKFSKFFVSSYFYQKMNNTIKTLLGVCFLGLMVSCSGCKTDDTPPIVTVSDDSTMLYIANERVKLGVDLTLGGAVTYLSDEANGGKNMVNSFDWGRQIQMSYYSGPWPYIGPNGERPAPEWEGLGWNPIQSGDAGNNRSKMVLYEKRGENAIFVRSIPMQWPHKSGIAGECLFECLYTLEGNVITMEATLVNNRSDKTQYPTSAQEMPAVYTNGPWYKLVTYLGDKPFTGEPTTTIVERDDQKGWPWVHFYTPENWAALIDDNGYGIGVFQPEVMNFNGGFHPNDSFKGYGGEKDGQTGHIAPVGKQIIDHNIRLTYTTSLVLGTVDDIRSYARENRLKKSTMEWEFLQERDHWYYQGDAKDSGFPIEGGLDIQFNRNAALVGPETFWQSSDAPFLEIEGAFTTQTGELELLVEVQPFAKSDLTDWLNWSEGPFSVEEERKRKAAEFPSKPPVTTKQTIISDGSSRVHKVDLSAIQGYQGGMKNVKIYFTEPGKATVTKIALGKSR